MSVNWTMVEENPNSALSEKIPYWKQEQAKFRYVGEEKAGYNWQNPNEFTYKMSDLLA